MACTFLADEAIKRLLHRRRPPRYHGNEAYEGLPSGHTASVVAIAVTVSHVLARAGTWCRARDTVRARDVVASARLGCAVARAVLAS